MSIHIPPHTVHHPLISTPHTHRVYLSLSTLSQSTPHTHKVYISLSPHTIHPLIQYTPHTLHPMIQYTPSYSTSSHTVYPLIQYTPSYNTSPFYPRAERGDFNLLKHLCSQKTSCSLIKQGGLKYYRYGQLLLQRHHQPTTTSNDTIHIDI